MTEKERLETLEAEIANALRKRDANIRGEWVFQYFLDYRGDPGLMALFQAEDEAKNNYMELSRAAQGIMGKGYVNDGTEWRTDSSPQAVSMRDWDHAHAFNELLSTGYAYVEAINRHENARFRLMESARNRVECRERQAEQPEEGGQLAEVSQPVRRTGPPTAQ